MPQVQDNARVFFLIFLLFWLASSPDTGPGLIAGPAQVRNRIAHQRAAHAVLNSTAWGDFAPRLADDPPETDETETETEYRYLNLTGFREEDKFAWEDLGRFKSRCEEWSRNAVGIPETQEPVWQNATGVVRGLWQRSNASVSRTHSSYNLTHISPDVAWNGLNSDWSRNVTGQEGKILVRIDDPEDAATEPERLDTKIFHENEVLARHVSTTVSVEDVDGTGNSWEMRMHGVHWPKPGVMLFTTTSDKYAGIFGLPHLTTGPEFFESSQALLNRTLGSTLDKKERRAFTDQSDPWASTIDAPAEVWNPAPHCEYLLYIQIHPLDHDVLQVQPSLTGPENIIKAIHNIENELRFPQGTPHRSAPRLQMSAVLYSPDCAFFLESKGPPAYAPVEGEHLSGVKQEVFLYNVSTWLLGLAFVLFAQVQLLKWQMRETSTPSTLGRVSFYTGSWMLLADGIVVAGSSAWSLSASNTLLPSLVVTCVSFLSVTIGIFFVSEIYKVQEPEWRRQERERERQTPPPANAARPQQPTNQSTTTPGSAPANRERAPSPPVIIPSDQDIDAEIAEINNASTNNATLPAPVTAGTTTASPQNTGTPISTIFGRFVLIGICILFLSLAAITWRPSIRVAYFNIVVFAYMSLWTPQIYRNVYRNCRQALSWPFVIGQSILRLLPIAYFYVWSENFAFAEPDWTAFTILVGWVWAQIWVLIGQSVLGPRFGLPKGWMPEAWEYHPVLREDNIEAGGLPIGLVSMPSSPVIERVKSGDDSKDKKRTNIHVIDCAICREDLEVPVVKAGEEDPTAGGVAGVFARRMYMVTPCRHIFHSACLEGWMRFRLQCPIFVFKMRLLNVETRELKEFIGDEIPRYAILSHTWGEEEVTFQDLQHRSHKEKHGYAKIEQTCRLAAVDRLRWIWVDTCCIDKSSSAELSEAINSMFEWYQEAEVCYAFLADVSSSKPGDNIEEAFRNARWLTRGWTLQEFLAPSPIRLFNSTWQKLEPSNFPSIFDPHQFDECELDAGKLDGSDLDNFESELLLHFTGIDKRNWKAADVPTILSWAARRRTSRQEDMAYCLLGLLDVKMPLLYGEGAEAFPRLLEELMKKSNSHGVLAAWYGLPPLSLTGYGYLLPKSPWPYAGCKKGFQDILVAGRSHSLHFTLTNAGLSIELPLVEIDSRNGVVNPQLAIVLNRRGDDQYGQIYYRASQPLSVPIEFHRYARRENIYIGNNPQPYPPNISTMLRLLCADLQNLGYEFNSVYPPFPVERYTRSPTADIRCHYERDTFVVLFTATDSLPNIVLFISVAPSDSSGRFLVALTDSVSVIEFLLKEEAVHDADSVSIIEFMSKGEKVHRPVGINVARATPLSDDSKPTASTSSMNWSTQIDLENVETRSCWGRDVHISAPGSLKKPGERFRVSAASIENKLFKSTRWQIIQITAAPTPVARV
ncbi:hypothetical protein F5Y03DRAFT_381539 [Xylaria venustula]|nr:hypothetical protein F5Y03DRAFT_381539 [Xylaria venustula]